MADSKNADLELKATDSHLETMKDEDNVPVDYAGAAEKTSPEEKRLVKKIDWIMLPVLWVMYWFNYLDRNAITVARLDGMEEELGLTGSQYQTCVSILFVGYILGQIPSSKYPAFTSCSPILTILAPQI